MKDALLAVRVDGETLKKFRAKCAELKIKQSEVITDFLNDFLEGKKKPSSQYVAITPEVLDNRITECITEYLDEKLDNCITERITEYLDNVLGQGVTNTQERSNRDSDPIAPQNELKLERLEEKGIITPETENDGIISHSEGGKLDIEQVESTIGEVIGVAVDNLSDNEGGGGSFDKWKSVKYDSDELATRLGKSGSTIRGWKSKNTLKENSQKNDPDKLIWTSSSEGKKTFYIVDIEAMKR